MGLGFALLEKQATNKDEGTGVGEWVKTWSFWCWIGVNRCDYELML